MHINWAHVHLMINHFPVIGLFGAILIYLYAMIRKSDEVRMVGLGVFVLIALMTIAVFFTGQAAQDIVKKIPGVTESYIGRHEEMADFAITLVEALGFMSLAGLVIMRRTGKIPQWLSIIVLILSLAAAAVVGLTANLGGEIRHTEIRDK